MKTPKRARLKYKKSGSWHGTTEGILSPGGVLTAAYTDNGGYQVRLAKHDGTDEVVQGKSHSVKGAKILIRKKLVALGADLDEEVRKPRRKAKR